MQEFAPSSASPSLHGFYSIVDVFLTSSATNHGSSVTCHQAGVCGNKSESRSRNPREQGKYFGAIVRNGPPVAYLDAPLQPLLVSFSSICDDAQMTVLELIGVHAPRDGMIGQNVSAVVMESGSVISGHAEESPYSITYTVLCGKIAVLAFVFAPESPINHIPQDVDMLVDSEQVRSLISKGFRPCVFDVEEKGCISVGAGTYVLVIAMQDSGQWLYLSLSMVLCAIEAQILSPNGAQHFILVFLCSSDSYKESPCSHTPPSITSFRRCSEIHVEQSLTRDAFLASHQVSAGFWTYF
jgi:hypothetical protein